jgi:hypothetical protein
MERAGELLRLVSQRLVSDLGMTPSPTGPSVFESPGMVIELENRDGEAMIRVRQGGEVACLRFVQVQSEEQAALAIDWIRRCVEVPQLSRRSSRPSAH